MSLKDIAEIKFDQETDNSDTENHDGHHYKGGKKNSIKRIIAVVLIIVLLLIGGIAGWNLNRWLAPSDQGEVKSIREQILPVTKLGTYDYNFTEILKFSDSNKILNWDVPLTDNMYIATVDGTASIGVNLGDDDQNKLTVNEDRDDEGHLRGVTINIPHSEVFNVAIDNSTLDVLDNRDNIFNHFTSDEFNALLASAQSEQKQKVQDSDLLDKSDQRIQDLITTAVHDITGDESVEVTVSFYETESKPTN